MASQQALILGYAFGLPHQTDKLEFVGEDRTSNNIVIPNQCALLLWESPSNSRLPIVIQVVLFYRFPEFIHEKLCFYPGDCHASVRYFIAMTGNSMARQIPIYGTEALTRSEF